MSNFNKPTNPPAFPTGTGVTPYNSGMTLRDYFAAQAMQKTMIEFDNDWKTHAYEQLNFIQWASERAYAMADAMLKAREA